MNDYANDNASVDERCEMYKEDEEGIVEPIILLATWHAHQEHPIPFDTECHGYDDRMHDHCEAFRIELAAMAPKLLTDLKDAVWELHHRAYLRLGEYMDLFPLAYALKDLPADLVYAIASTPYTTLTSGKRSLCLETLARKRQWYIQRRT